MFLNLLLTVNYDKHTGEHMGELDVTHFMYLVKIYNTLKYKSNNDITFILLK